MREKINRICFFGDYFTVRVPPPSVRHVKREHLSSDVRVAARCASSVCGFGRGLLWHRYCKKKIETKKWSCRRDISLIWFVYLFFWYIIDFVPVWRVRLCGEPRRRVPKVSNKYPHLKKKTPKTLRSSVRPIRVTVLLCWKNLWFGWIRIPSSSTSVASVCPLDRSRPVKGSKVWRLRRACSHGAGRTWKLFSAPSPSTLRPRDVSPFCLPCRQAF